MFSLALTGPSKAQQAIILKFFVSLKEFTVKGEALFSHNLAKYNKHFIKNSLENCALLKVFIYPCIRLNISSTESVM